MPPKRGATGASASKRAKKSDDAEEGETGGASEAGCFGMKWSLVGQGEKGLPLMMALDGDKALKSKVVAGFDIDWTIIQPKSGAKFPKSPDDWKFWDTAVPAQLRALHDKGTKVVFFTNQGGIEKGKESVKGLQGKFENIVKAIGFPITVICCAGYNQYRKPSITVWKYFEDHCNGGIAVDRADSVFVGDAAGRPKDWHQKGTPKDFSAGDRMFAANVGLKFSTPEAFFLQKGEHPVFHWDALDPKKFVEDNKHVKAPQVHPSKTQEMVVLVGRPASGKSTFADRYFVPHGYVSVNRDTLNTAAKCIKVADTALGEGKSVVVDNTNPSPSSRKEFLDLARKHKVPARCFFLDVTQELSDHLNFYRQTQTEGERRRVPEVGMNVFKSQFEAPSLSEGFTTIEKIDFVPKFDTERDKELFFHWQCTS